MRRRARSRRPGFLTRTPPMPAAPVSRSRGAPRSGRGVVRSRTPPRPGATPSVSTLQDSGTTIRTPAISPYTSTRISARLVRTRVKSSATPPRPPCTTRCAGTAHSPARRTPWVPPRSSSGSPAGGAGGGTGPGAAGRSARSGRNCPYVRALSAASRRSSSSSKSIRPSAAASLSRSATTSLSASEARCPSSKGKSPGKRPGSGEELMTGDHRRPPIGNTRERTPPSRPLPGCVPGRAVPPWPTRTDHVGAPCARHLRAEPGHPGRAARPAPVPGGVAAAAHAPRLARRRGGRDPAAQSRDRGEEAARGRSRRGQGGAPGRRGADRRGRGFGGRVGDHRGDAPARLGERLGGLEAARHAPPSASSSRTPT